MTTHLTDVPVTTRAQVAQAVLAVMASYLPAPIRAADTAEGTEALIRAHADVAESRTLGRGPRDIVSAELHRRHLLEDYRRIKAGTQHLAFG